MPLNLELKVKMNSFRKTAKLLKEINAHFLKTLNQKDIYYKTTGGLLKLRIENGEQSIIKYLRDEKGKDRFSDYEFISFESGDAEKFFKNIFNIEAVVQKKRLLFIYDNTRIHLDTVKGLGKFLELETLVLKGKNDAKKRFAFVKKALELETLPGFKKSYRDLIISSKKSK